MVVARERESRRAGGRERENLVRGVKKDWSRGGEMKNGEGFSVSVCDRRNMCERGKGRKGRKAVEGRGDDMVRRRGVRYASV